MAHRRSPAFGLWSFVFGLLALTISACSQPATPEPTAQPALVPLRPRPTEPGPAPTVAAAGAGLPGRLLFVQGGNLWLWQGETGRQISSSGDAFQPAFAPDGERIAYVRRQQSYSDLVVMPAAGGEPLRLTDDGPDSSVYSYERIYASMWAFYPAWSPDGTTIAYASQGGPPAGEPAGEYNMSLFAIPAGAGGRRAQLYAADEGHVGRPAWSPDGQSIVFAFAPAGQGIPALYRYTPASESAAPLAGAPAQSYDPAFASDGKLLAFAARDGARTDIFAMPAGGGTPVRLTGMGSARAPAFSPDGTLLAFLALPPATNGFELWVVELQTGADGALQPGQPRQITHDMRLDADSGIAWAR
ncbi:MAG: PD40 domain-containing protein [Kouleothrix sp.]|nr:PD40 domain-containing protein [Kouleothrix sp.]